MSTTVLILEDEPAIAELIRERFDDEGYEVKVAMTGAEALARLKEGKPDLVTLDICLPDANGLDLLHDMKEDPATHSIPVIIISSLDDEEEKARKMGAEAFLPKPINFSRLFEIVDEVKVKVKP